MGVAVLKFFLIMARVFITSVYYINICHISSEIQNLMLNTSYILF